MACRYQQGYISDSQPTALSHFGHHHLLFIFYCLCQQPSHDPPQICFCQIPELQLLMNSIVPVDSFVLTPTSFPTVYCSVNPLPPNYSPLFLANMYKHGLCTCTQSSISSVWPCPVFASCQGQPQLASLLMMTKGFEVLDGVMADLYI